MIPRVLRIRITFEAKPQAIKKPILSHNKNYKKRKKRKKITFLNLSCITFTDYIANLTASHVYEAKKEDTLLKRKVL